MHKYFECDECAYRAVSSEYIKKHMLTRTGDKSFKCDKCAYRAVGGEYINKHMVTHTGEKPFACEQRDYNCGRAYELVRHRARKHECKSKCK